MFNIYILDYAIFILYLMEVINGKKGTFFKGKKGKAPDQAGTDRCF